MAVDLFSLRMNIETSGLAQATTGLREVDAAGKQAALSATNFANAWEGAKIKFAGTAAEMAVFKQSFSTGFFNEKMIAGMSLAGQEGAAASAGFSKMSQGIANASAQWRESVKAQTQKVASTSLLSSGLTQLLAIYGGFKILHFAHDTLENAAALHEMSQKTGASAEALSVLRFAGNLAEVSMDQIATGFRGMAVSIGNLRDGVPDAVEKFGRLGITFKDLENLSPEQRFIKLAIAVGGMKDATERADVAQTLFGRSGNMLIPLLEDLATNGWAKTREEAEKYHAVVSQATADQSDAFLDSVHMMTGALGGLMRDVLTPMLPVFTGFIQLLQKSVDLTKEWVPWLLRLVPVLGPVIAMSPSLGRFADVTGGSSTADATPGGGYTPPPHKATADDKAAAKRARDEYVRQVLGLAGMDSSMHPADKLAFQGVAASHLALRGGGVGALHGGTFSSSSGEDLSGSLGGDLSTLFEQGGDGKTQAGRMSILAAFAREAKRGAVALKVQFAQIGTQLGTTLAAGFATAIAAGIRGKNVFKAFGNVIMSGLGSIMGQMGHAMIQQGIILMHLLPFLSNPFSSGPALIAAGIALTALGSTLGGIAGGHGGGGSGGGGRDNFGDHTTNITLTPPGAGGKSAPLGMGGMTPIEVIGIDSPRGTAALSKGMAATKRRNM